jgi:glycosyltransferase involved in cell wall biosynthesis
VKQPPGAPLPLVFCAHPGDALRAGRTLRALRRKGLSPLDAERLDSRALAAHIDPARPLWLLRAGAFPARPEPLLFPPPSATGRPLCAFGAVRALPDEPPSPGAKAWSALLARTGGDLADATLDAPLLASVYLDADAATALRLHLDEGRAIPAALDALTSQSSLRRVRFSPLDVHHDEALRVALAVTSLQRGGAERVVIDLHHTLAELGHRPTVLTLGRPTRAPYPSPPGTIDLSEEGTREERVDALAERAIERGADLVHAHLLDLGQLERLSTHAIPVAVTVHNTRAGWPEGLERLEARHASLLIACSLAAEADLERAGFAIPARTIWNGIDTARLRDARDDASLGASFRRAQRIPEGDLLLLAVANPRPQKRLHLLPTLLLGAQAELDRRKIPRRARLVLAGDPSPENGPGREAASALRRAVQEQRVAERVHFAGLLADIAPALAAADALVSVSAHEGLSLAHLEALAAGVPVIATDAGGTRELAWNNPAIEVLPLDTPPARLGALAVDRALARPEGGPDLVLAHFDRDRMGARHPGLYRRVIAAARPPRERRGIVLITNNFSTGGAQSSARRLLTGLAARGERARAIVLEEQESFPTPGRSALERAGVPVLAVPDARKPDAAATVEWLLERLDDDPPRAVVFWNALAELKILLADHLLATPIFDISPGEMYFASLERWLARGRPGLPYRDARAYGRRLAGVIVKYEAEAEKARDWLGAPVHVIPNGVDLGPLPGERREGACLILGTAARLSPQKKLTELLDALRLALPDLPPCVLRIAGGPERGSEAHAEALRERARDLPVEWLGDLEDTSSMLAELDVFTMISEPAGCPNASLEAMARGLPVIATDVGGASEQVIDGVTGRLVPRGDVPAFAAALVALGRDASLRRALGRAARARAEERFDARRMIEEYRRVCLGG